MAPIDHRTTFVVAAAAVVASMLVVSGQQSGAGQNLLKGVKSLKCSFTASATGSWQDGEPQVRVRPGKSDLTLTISKIDIDEGSATIVGPSGRSSVTVKLSGSNLFFLDLRPSGAAMLTTVFAQESKGKRLKAAHTQTEPDVAQFYGDCEILP